MQGEGPPASVSPHQLHLHRVLLGRGAGVSFPWLVHVHTPDKRPHPPHPHQPFTHTHSTEQGRALQPALDDTLEMQIVQ